MRSNTLKRTWSLNCRDITSVSGSLWLIINYLLRRRTQVMKHRKLAIGLALLGVCYLAQFTVAVANPQGRSNQIHS